MPANISPLERLEAALSDTAGVYVNAGVDAATYYAQLADDIRGNMHEPFPLSAVVMPPGFSNANIGDRISGQCVAHSEGYWLVYHPVQDTFIAFGAQIKAILGREACQADRCIAGPRRHV